MLQINNPKPRIYASRFLYRVVLRHSHPFAVLHRGAGQVLILTILTIGGILLGATTIAGLLVAYQISQGTDLANSGKAIFAADTGIEWGLYQFFKPGFAVSAPTLSNGASFTATCSPVADCKDIGTAVIRSAGKSANAERAFELNL